MSSFPNNHPWGHTNNGALNNETNQHVGLHGGQQVNRPPYQNSWQQPVPPQYQQQQMAQQPIYQPNQQTYWNNNVNQKPQPVPQPDGNTWAHMQAQYAPQPQQQPQQHQVSFNNPQNPYSFDSYPQNISAPQQGYQQANHFEGDAWNWGWEESSNSTPSASFSTNNNFQNDPTWDWNVDDNTQEFQATNPVQNYFQPNQKVEQFQNKEAPQNTFKNEEQPQDDSKVSLETKNETDEYSKPLTVENIAEVNFQSEESNDTVFDVKSESANSYQSGSLSNTSEFKTERSSPDPNKIPLTTQALREFHKEIYENGPVDLKSRHNAEGLTPQWSIESQMSQDTVSDDISPSVQGGSQSDLDTRPSTVSQSPSSNQHAEGWYEYQENTPREENVSNLQETKPRIPHPLVTVRNDLYEEVSTNLEGLSITEDVENKEIVSPEQRNNSKPKIALVTPIGPIGPPPVRPGEGSSNPYSAGSLNRKKRTDLINPTFQAPVIENENYANQDNQQIISIDQNFRNDNNWFKNTGLTEESVNLETVPDNKERPDSVEHSSRHISSSSVNNRISVRPMQSYSNVSPDNYEVAPRVGPDRNQYLETGQLGDQGEIAVTDVDVSGEPLPPPGLSRLVTGERQSSLNSNTENSAGDVSTPPPGLDRMVLGQMTENENSAIPQSTPPPGLHRMVLGQLTDDQNQNSTEENPNVSSSNTARDDIPPPGFHRMIPGESSSPETQNVIQLSIDTLPREQRVVTGVARDEIDVNTLQANIPSASPTPANRLSSQPTSPEENRIQFQSERCETIGSDNVDNNYAANQGDNSSNKQIKRKDKDRDRDRLREDISSDEREREPSRRRDRDSDYYSPRDRNLEREDPPSGERQRYRDDRGRRSKNRDRVDWDRDRRKDSPGRYKEDKDRRRDYRDDRRRNRDYDYSDDDDEDVNGYYSDRDRRNMSGYREDFDKSYSRRDDRARSLRPEKSPRDGNEDRSSGRRGRRGYNDQEEDRERDRDRDRDRDQRHPDYYRRRGHDEIDDYRESQRSRPSSRNGSVHGYKHRGHRDHEGDRERDRDNYRGHSKRDRDMYHSQYNYDPAYYNYYYQYYENLRRTNPAAYAEFCRKYYAQSQHGTFEGTYTEDRGSVHSGRSSANEDNKDRYIKTEQAHTLVPPHLYPCYQPLDQSYPYHSYSSDTGEHDAGRRLDSSLQLEDTSTSVQRLTPAKFTTAHVKGTLTPRGQMIKILAHYPLDGQPATLEVYDQLACLEDARKELQDFPGPLVKGTTHKNNVLRYCKQKIKDADSNPNLFDKDSYKLIWELLILMIRQNGTVVGTDIAELLMSNRKANASIHQPTPSPATSHHSINDVGGNQSNLSEEEVTNQFRDYLIYGNTKEALEWAMKHGLWGHALFLASKMDQRTYASVMTRFANGLTMNDPLQTLYQLMSGRQPAAVTCCADEKWGDWRPHLAMILSNSTARPDLDVKAITTLGDTLGSRGSLHAAHFCYLMAQVGFGTYAHKSSKIVLIGSSHNQPFNKFSSNEAIFATEIFEFACNLADPDFVLHHLQVYKLIIARRLAEAGALQESVHYVEVIANTIAKQPSQYTPSFIQEVYDLGDMLKYFDPVYNNSEAVEDSNNDPEWLVHLLNILNDYQLGVLQHVGYGSVSNLTTYSENDNIQNLPLDPIPGDSTDAHSWQQQQQQQQQRYYEQSVQQQQWQSNDHGVNGFPSMNTNEGFAPVEQPLMTTSPSEDANRSYWSNQNQWMAHQQPQEQNITASSGGEYNSGTTPETAEANKPRPSYDYYDSSRNEGMQQQVTLPGTVTLPNSKPRTTSQSSEDRKPSQVSKPKTTKKDSSKVNQSSGSWFGGLWNKLALRPKNQMILPDDKDPSIVWDPDKKRWVNLDGDEDVSGGALPPPPKASGLPTAPSQPAPPSFNSNNSSEQPEAITAPQVPLSGPNKYKMPKGKSLRSNYVDVMNQGSNKTSNPSIPTPDLFPTFGYSSQVPTNYFIPAPVEGNENAPTDFLTPSPAPVLSAHDSSDQSQQPTEDYQTSSNPQWNGINIGQNLNRLPANQSVANTSMPRTQRYPK